MTTSKKEDLDLHTLLVVLCYIIDPDRKEKEGQLESIFGCSTVSHNGLLEEQVVSRSYIRGQNRTGRLVFCLSEYLCIEKSKNELFEMSYILI